MASKSSDDIDPLIDPAQKFSSFLDNLVEEAGLSGSIQNIDEFKQVTNTFIDMIKRNANYLPEGITKTKLKTFFQKKQMQDGGNGINMLGGIIMANICRSKLMRLQEDADSQGLSALAGERINSFFNEGFVTRFSQAIPFRGNTGDAGSGVLRRGTQAQSSSDEEEEDETSDGSYTKFYNELFNVTKKRFKWRGDIFAPVSNDLQCLRAMGDSSAASTVHDLHDSGTLKCYICGCKIKSLGGARGQDKMQCEHILPIITALAHWWLVKPKGRTPSSLVGEYSEETARLLANEYAWSHACCNLIKNNWEIIEIGPDGCRPNTRGISALLQAIWEGSHPPTQFDCGEVNSSTNNCLKKLSDTPWSRFKASTTAKKQKKAITDLLKSLTNRITMNIEETANWQLYQLLTKFKVIAAMTDDNFLSVLLDKTSSDLPEDVLASGQERQIEQLKNIVDTTVDALNQIIKEDKKQQKLIAHYTKKVKGLFNQHNRAEDIYENYEKSSRYEDGSDKQQKLLQALSDIEDEHASYKRMLRDTENSIEYNQETIAEYEYAMMMALKDYLEGGGNEFLVENSRSKLWFWSGKEGEYLSDSDKESYIADIVAMDNPVEEKPSKRRKRRGGRKRRYSDIVDHIQQNELINPELLKTSIGTKEDLMDISTDNNIKLEIKEKSENKHYNLTFTQEQIDKGKSLKSKMMVGYNNANIFIDSINNVNGPSINLIKDELVKLFTEERNENLQSKLKTPLDIEFINEIPIERLNGGGRNTRKVKRNRKKTKKQKHKRKKTRRRKNKFTKRRRKN